MSKLFLTFFLSSLSINCLAEYRVFQYIVKSNAFKTQDTGTYIVTSTMNPQTYIAYHGGPGSIVADLVRTWRCPGHTGNNKDLCKGPYERVQNFLNLQE